MSKFIDRLKNKTAELKAEIDALHNFIISEKFTELDTQKQYLLRLQLPAMETYYECLLLRLEDLGETTL